MPAQGARKPIHLTSVPVNRNVAWAPADRLNEDVFALQPRLRLPCHHGPGRPGALVPGVYAMPESVFSTRVNAAALAGGIPPFETLTATAADVAVLPAISRATAVSVCDPSATVVVSQLME